MSEIRHHECLKWSSKGFHPHLHGVSTLLSDRDPSYGDSSSDTLMLGAVFSDSPMRWVE